MISSREEADLDRNIYSISVANHSDILLIPTELIDNFAGHPFCIDDSDPDMMLLVDSIRISGVIIPAIVRETQSGRYELISGHRRKRASELLNIPTLPCQVLADIDDTQATILMVESNIQRTVLLPSEKALAYKMLLDALKHQGKRNTNTSYPVGTKSVDEVKELFSDSSTQVYRYIRLTYLIPELLQICDYGRMKLRPAVEVSYLNHALQKALYSEIEKTCSTPSYAQTRRFRQLYNDSLLTASMIAEIMREEKPNQKEKLILDWNRYKELIPSNLTDSKRCDYIYRALLYFNQSQRRKINTQRS